MSPSKQRVISLAAMTLVLLFLVAARTTETIPPPALISVSSPPPSPPSPIVNKADFSAPSREATLSSSRPDALDKAHSNAASTEHTPSTEHT
eukprot:CAMPEP_0174745310 /NCGR_PEP_ID=MMETSP1094-20130205/86501_1 /TAXON_ID=156173 /ORGANISM="Chrysochromulina brevifilum, Strain UTEX LB 985" /LENGTH=91 /DNA_ID=CAMNT_0015949841 /DNA_START=62 /DNA_END=333 /DNA_ORIENTATION=+